MWQIFQYLCISLPYGTIQMLLLLLIIMVTLCNRADHYIFMLWFVLLLLLLSFFSSPYLSRRRLDLAILPHNGVALVRI